jgi:E3 ubiquitin-protein ligase TRIP12
LFDIISFDAELGKTLRELQVLVERKRFLESTSGKNQLEVEDLRFRGARIEDLCLDFTLPGFPDHVLKEGGQNTTVSNFFISVNLCLHLLSSY